MIVSPKRKKGAEESKGRNEDCEQDSGEKDGDKKRN
jgi:hypothetical protein